MNATSALFHGIACQLVHCDNLTGAGALAPVFLLEREPAALCTAHIRAVQK